MQNYQDMKNMFIDAVFITAESGDWNKINFEKLCKVLKVKPSEGYKLFPGVESILDFYSEQITDLVRENLDKKELREVLPREALLEVLMCRLDLLNPRKSALKIITEHSMRDPCSLVFTLKRVKKSMNIMISESEINIKRGSGFILEKSISIHSCEK